MRTLGKLVFAVATVFSIPAMADGDADAKYKQGLAYKQQGKTDDAIKALESAVASNPKHGMAWASLGHLYKQKGDVPKAITAYENATAVQAGAGGARRVDHSRRARAPSRP